MLEESVCTVSKSSPEVMLCGCSSWWTETQSEHLICRHLLEVSVGFIWMQPAHHPPDYDDFRAQGPTDGEDGHETKAEDHKVDAKDDFTRIEQLSGQPETEKVDDLSITQHLKGPYQGLKWLSARKEAYLKARPMIKRRMDRTSKIFHMSLKYFVDFFRNPKPSGSWNNWDKLKWVVWDFRNMLI